MRHLIIVILSFCCLSTLYSQEHLVTVKKGETTLDIFSDSPGSALIIEKVNTALSPVPALVIINRTNSNAISASSTKRSIVANFSSNSGGTAVRGNSSSQDDGQSNYGGFFESTGINSNGVRAQVFGDGTSTNPQSENGYGGYFKSNIAVSGGVYGEGHNGVFGRSFQGSGNGGYFLATGSDSYGIYAEGQRGIRAIGIDTGIVVKAPLAGVFLGNVSVSERISTENLTVSGVVKAGTVDVLGDVKILGGVEIQDDIVVANDIFCGGDVEFQRDLTVQRNLMVDNQMYCDGNAQFNSDVTVLQDFQVGSFLYADMISQRLGIGTASPGRELHVMDTNSNGDAIGEFSSSSGNLIIGMNISSGGLIGTTTNQPLRIRTNNTNRMVVTKTGNIGMGRSTADYRLDVNGDIRYSGELRKNSDRRYKKDIETLDRALEKINKLRGVSYTYRINEFPEMSFDDSQQIGFIAQELEPLFPELVETDTEGYKSVDYPSMTAVLVQAMNEQQVIIEELRKKNKKMEDSLLALAAMVDARLSKIEKDEI